VSAHAPTARDAATPPAGVHSPPAVLPIPHSNFYNRETLLDSDATRVGEDGAREGGELHRGASRRGGRGPTAAYHYNILSRRAMRDWKKGRATHTTTFFALARNQSMSMTPPTHDFIECKRHASVRRGIDFKFCVECGRFIIIAPARTLVS
jgi:hypothetical protein